MTSCLRSLVAVGVVLGLAAGASTRAQEGGAPLVENPLYKFWSSFKVGSTNVCQETTKLGDPSSKLWTPDGVADRRLTSKLVEINEKHAVVEVVVTEREFLGYVQAAPTRHIYPAKVRKQDLVQFFQESGATTGEDTLKVEDKDMKVRTVAGTIKSPDGQEVEYKLWISDEVPGSIVKKMRTTRAKGEVIAETTSTVVACKKAD
ncbi:hypothetical protein J0H58_03060 [bacterium]|nr:hypothetical protein [bacterium]